MEPTAKKRRGCLFPFTVILVIFAVFAVLIAVGVSSSEAPAARSLLAKTMDLAEQQEQDMLAVFDACGIVELKEVTEFQSGEGHTSYHINDDETEHYSGVDNAIVVWVTDSTKAVEAIYFADQDIYVNGSVVAQVSDYYVSSAQRDEYRVTAQLLVKQCLNYPDTAQFGAASKWSFGVRDGYDVIQSSVTAKNAFGVESTERFQVKINRGSGEPVSLIIGNTEYIN